MNNVVLLLLCLAPLGVLAQSASEKELAQLREQRDKAIAAASEPINHRYQTSLEQMLRRTMQAGDLEGAVKIKAALSELGVAAAAVVPPAEPARLPLLVLMEGSRWAWYNSAEPKGPSNNWVEFYKNGTGKSGWNQPLHYSVESPNSLKVTQGENGPSWFFTYDAGKREARYDAVAGAGHEERSMKLERKISPVGPTH